MKLLNLFEKVLIAICHIFFAAVGMAILIHEKIVRIFAAVLMFILGIAAFFVIGLLPARWESLVLQTVMIGSSVTFVGMLILRFWKAEKFAKIFDKHLEKYSKNKV